MIPRITRGSSAYGALHYDHGPGRRDEHRNPHKVAGNVAGRTWKERSYAIDDHVKRTNPKLTNPVIRTSLRIAPEDRRLTDREWRSIANEYVGKMGFSESPWEAVRHADDHIHLTMSRVKWDGTVVDQWKDKLRAQEAVRGIERNHNLIDASKRYDRDLPQVSGNDRERADRLSQKAGLQIDPEKVQLRNRITDAERASNGTRASFEAELEQRGINHRANVSRPTERNPEGRMNGYSYGLDGHTDKTGEQVWFKGSALGKQYSWQQQQQRLNERNTDHTRSAATGRNDRAGERATEPQEFEGKTARSGVAAAPSSNSVDQEKANETPAREDRREAAQAAHRHDREQPTQTAAPSRRQDATTGHTQAGESQERQQEDRNAARGAMSREDAREAARAAIREREQARAETASTDASKDSSGQRSSPRDEESRRTTDDRKSRSGSDRATEPERIPSRPMSRDDARAAARQSAEDRTQPERPESHYDKSEAGGATKGQGASTHEVTSTSTEGASPMKPGQNQSSSDNKMTREEAQEEARRQAQERDERREQHRERETEQER